MNRSLLSLFAVCALTVAPRARAQSSAPGAAPRMIAPVPQPGATIPGLRLSWSISPGSVRFDPRYAPAALSSTGPVGPNGFPAPNVPVNITLRLHNDTAAVIDVGDGGGDEAGWQLRLSGPGAVSIETRSPCRLLEIVRMPRVVHVPAHGDAEIVLDGLTVGGPCPASAWFYSAPGHYVVEGALRTRYAVGGGPPNIRHGTPVTLAIPQLAFDVTR